jgi:hypothetical protein
MKQIETQDKDNISSRGNIPETQKYAETAIKVFDYIYTLPELEASFVFKTLLDEALELASHLNQPEVSKQFYKSVCEYCNKDIDITPLCRILTQNEDKVADALQSIIRNDANRLRDLSHTSLPSTIEILNIRDFFVPTIAEKGYNQVKSYFVMMTSGINLKEMEDNFSSEDGIKENIFSFLGYQTIFYKVFIDLSNSKNDNDDRTTIDENLQKELKTFVALYCKGELLYYVFKTIFNTKIIRISLNLWNSIIDYCKKDGIFCEIAQKRFNDYQSFWGGIQTSLSNYRFQTNDFLFNESCKPLGELYYEKYPRKNEQKPNYSELYYFLLRKKIINSENCSMDNFRNMFRNEGKVRPINLYLKNENIVALFIQLLNESLNEKKETHKDFLERVKLRFHFYVLKKGSYELSNLNNRTMRGDSINQELPIVREIKEKFRNCNFVVNHYE